MPLLLLRCRLPCRCALTPLGCCCSLRLRVVNWDYCALVRSLQHHAKAPLSHAHSELFTVRAETEGQFAAALSAALSPQRAGQLAFIEAVLDTDDVSSQLMEFGASVGAANGRQPSPQ